MASLDDALDTIAKAIADRILRELGPLGGSGGAPRYADAKSNPLGSARAFLDAGRRGDFPTYRRSRAVVALWVDVEAYIERRRNVARAGVVDAADDREALKQAGIQLRRP